MCPSINKQFILLKAHLIVAVKVVYSFINTTTVKEVPFQTSSKMLRCMLTLSCVRFFLTPWTITHQVPLSMEFSRQEYWGRLPCPPAGELPDPGIKPTSPAWQVDSLPLGYLGRIPPTPIPTNATTSVITTLWIQIYTHSISPMACSQPGSEWFFSLISYDCLLVIHPGHT